MSRYRYINGSLVPIAGFQIADVTLDTTSEQPIQNAAVANAVNAVNEYGCKNLLPNTMVTQVDHAVTFTVNSDGSIHVNGTASGWAIISGLGVVTLQPGTYKVTQPSDSNCYFFGRTGSDTPVFDTEDTFTLSTETTVTVGICVVSGATVDLIAYPMIRDSRFTNADYVPFAKSNRQLTQATTVIDYSSQLTGIPSGVTVKAYKYGRIVEVIAAAGTVSVAANSAKKIASYPAELTPIDINITEPSGSNNPDTHYVLKALSDGYYLKNSSSSAQTYIQGRIVYISAS